MSDGLSSVLRFVSCVGVMFLYSMGIDSMGLLVSSVCCVGVDRKWLVVWLNMLNLRK